MTTQTTTPAAATPQVTSFHYITTVQTRDGVLNTRDAILDVPAGFTRAMCFRHLTQQLADEYGTPLAVLYFALEPDALPTGAA
ncbi:hypothetical protein [Streptomyces roseifaciens]|uniref:hypothetical protein n=1 Tax=Streptomyces roseifaciens TaxID=1488406 RepID=UPI0007182B38|nr:hypothetical protein [Streptomyces roseifaciens]